MRDTIETLFDASPITGLVVAIIDKRAVTVYCSGELEGLPVSERTIWPVASLTKPVFVYGVLQLVQDGLLDLDQPLQSYLSEPYLADTEYLPLMTARHAMSHTTGLPNWRDSEGLRAGFRPGTRFSYSSEGLNYLQHVVEQLLGIPMADYLQQKLFSPFDMGNSVLRPETEATLPPYLTFLAQTLPANGAISLWTTLEDYARFVMAMFDSAIGREMHSAQTVVGRYPTLHWGLGWGLQVHAADRSFWHWGGRGIPRTLNFAIGWPEQQQAVILFTNHSDGLYLCRDIIHSLFPARPLPAFDWLLPAQQWRADGLLADA